MNGLFELMLMLPAAVLFATCLIPSATANRHARHIRRWVTAIAGAQAAMGIGLVAAHGLGVFPNLSGTVVSGPLPLGVYYDGISALMFALVSFVGWITCRYSIRYLDGEQNQGRYFRWSAFTIASVSLLVISGNLAMFFVCWVLTSLGLHQLLTHYGERAGAQRAAATKFAVGRLGDISLAGALALLYSEFNTLQFAELFASLDGSMIASPALQTACGLLVLAAITKSAQFPFHTWLPQTLETPTPVSALMHAGIVNAGGFLMIRMSPVLISAPTLLMVLAIIGAVTAIYGAVVMLTQTNIKKTLAYSTIAQMGFMMLQCGLGAFSAAMLHILAHSLYKAHAFLGSGGVMVDQAAMSGARKDRNPISVSQMTWMGIAIVGIFTLVMTLAGVNWTSKPGGWLLGGVICLALTQWMVRAKHMGGLSYLVGGFAIVTGLCVAYTTAFLSVDWFISNSLPANVMMQTNWILVAMVILGFIGMFFLQARVVTGAGSQMFQKWYVHASNGFYVESFLRRWLRNMAEAG